MAMLFRAVRDGAGRTRMRCTLCANKEMAPGAAQQSHGRMHARKGEAVLQHDLLRRYVVIEPATAAPTP